LVSPFPTQKILAFIPVVVIFYVLLVLPFVGADGQPRIVNILFWPLLAAGTLALAIYNRSRLDWNFIWSPPIVSLGAYLLFAAASIAWAFQPAFASSRYFAHLLAVICVVVPYALPIPTKNTMQRLHLCFAAAIALNAYYVFVTPSSTIGHPGYFVHKQELGMLCGATIILSAHELLFRGWRRLLAIVVLCLTFWVIFESKSKGSLAFLLPAVSISALALMACKLFRTTPAIILAVIWFASYFVNDPMGRIAFRLYGDSTITGRTFIWDFINMWVSQRSWLGWGFHSYWGVPNSPHNYAPGFVKDMISSHSGYLELKLGTGYVGYLIFMAFVLASLHVLERVRKLDYIRAWVLLSMCSYVIMLNLIESIWMETTALWMLYLVVVGETLRFAHSERRVAPAPSHGARHGIAKPAARMRSIGDAPKV
jgi:O-antigen ligase